MIASCEEGIVIMNRILTILLKNSASVLLLILIGCTATFKNTSNNLSSSSIKGQISDDFLRDIQIDMGLNEVPLLNAPTTTGWSKGGTIGMGIAPRGDATPVWWKPDNLMYKEPLTWNAIAPWFVIYPGVDHAATNVRVKIYKIEIYTLSKLTNLWQRLDTGKGNPTWAGVYDFNLTTGVGAINKRVEPDGLTSYKFDDSFHPIHGGAGKYVIDGNDIACVYATLTAELITDDPIGVDQRDLAQITVTVGADYYFDIGTPPSAFAPTYVPQSAQSRFGLVKSTPKVHFMATVEFPGLSVASPSSPYFLNGGKAMMPLAQFKENPPPGTTSSY